VYHYPEVHDPALNSTNTVPTACVHLAPV